MKKIILLFTLLLIGLLTTKATEKQKQYNEIFKVNENSKVKIDNNYGKVVFETWDKNEVEISVTVTVTGISDAIAEEKLNSIEIELSQNDDEVLGKTKFSPSKKGNIKSIDYLIKLPKTNSIKVDLNYGEIILANHIANISLNANYSAISVAEIIGKLTLNCNYSDCNLGKIEELKISSNYGDITINSIENLNANLTYGDLILKNLTTKANVNIAYNDVEMQHINPNFAEIEISAAYSDIKINVEKGSKYKVITSGVYSDFSMPNTINYSVKTEKYNTSSCIGNTDETAQSIIKVNTTYGDFKLIEK